MKRYIIHKSSNITLINILDNLRETVMTFSSKIYLNLMVRYMNLILNFFNNGLLIMLVDHHFIYLLELKIAYLFINFFVTIII